MVVFKLDCTPLEQIYICSCVAVSRGQEMEWAQTMTLMTTIPRPSLQPTPLFQPYAKPKHTLLSPSSSARVNTTNMKNGDTVRRAKNARSTMRAR